MQIYVDDLAPAGTPMSICNAIIQALPQAVSVAYTENVYEPRLVGPSWWKRLWRAICGKPSHEIEMRKIPGTARFVVFHDSPVFEEHTDLVDELVQQVRPMGVRVAIEYMDWFWERPKPVTLGML